MTLPPPATEAGMYLAAIHGVLCDIRTALVDGAQAPTARPGASDTSGRVELTEPAVSSQTKRTRQRVRG